MRHAVLRYHALVTMNTNAATNIPKLRGWLSIGRITSQWIRLFVLKGAIQHGTEPLFRHSCFLQSLSLWTFPWMILCFVPTIFHSLVGNMWKTKEPTKQATDKQMNQTQVYRNRHIWKQYRMSSIIRVKLINQYQNTYKIIRLFTSCSLKCNHISCVLLLELFSPAELKQSLGGERNTRIRPREEMELGHCACFTRLEILQVEAAYQIVITPDMFAHKVHLETEILQWWHTKSDPVWHP